MTNLFKMDLYRMRKAKSFWVCLILSFVFALSSTPLTWLLYLLGSLLTGEKQAFPQSTALSELLNGQPGSLGAMLTLLSICSFYYGDLENGYVKNIAGQVPQRGYTVLSKFLASIPHGLLFFAVSVLGKLLGTLILQRIEVDAGVPDSLRILCLRFLLLESLCAILLLFTGALQSKSLGTVFAVLFGMGLLSLVYFGIDAGLARLFPKLDFSISDYMPDQLMSSSDPDTLTSLGVSAVVIALFLWLSVRIFNKKDVK
ncbi:MAG: hypothetical protein IKS05_06240 [Oscillospiraceae bacterium]|nr:hypothetical protein [Oscillospiraceae bacterium]